MRPDVAPLSLSHILGAVQAYFGSVTSRQALAAILELSSRSPTARAELDEIVPVRRELGARTPRVLISVLTGLAANTTATVDASVLKAAFREIPDAPSARTGKRISLPLSSVQKIAPAQSYPADSATMAAIRRVAEETSGFTREALFTPDAVSSRHWRIAVAYMGSNLARYSPGRLAQTLGFKHATSVSSALTQADRAIVTVRTTLCQRILTLYRALNERPEQVGREEDWRHLEGALLVASDLLPPNAVTVAGVRQAGVRVCGNVGDHKVARQVWQSATYLADFYTGAGNCELMELGWNNEMASARAVRAADRALKLGDPHTIAILQNLIAALEEDGYATEAMGGVGLKEHLASISR